MKIKKGGWWVVSAFVTIMIRYSVTGGITDPSVPDIASKIINSFSNNAAMDALLLVGGVFLLTAKKEDNSAIDVPILAASIVFSALYVLGLCCQELGEFLVLFSNTPQMLMLILTASAYAIVFYHALRLLYLWMDKKSDSEEHCCAATQFPTLKVAAGIFLFWLPWLLMNYPCSFCNDATFSLKQWIGITPWTLATPPLSTAIMGVCYSIGKAMIDENFGTFLYCLLQTVCGALVFAAGIRECHHCGASKGFCKLAFAFYAFTPLWGLSCQWFEKSFLYTSVFTMAVILLLPIVRERDCLPRQAVLIGAVVLLAALLRADALMELYPALFLVTVLLQKRAKRWLAAASLVSFALFMLISNGLYPALGIKKLPTKEIMSVPFQQTARYCLLYPEEVTQEQYEAINAVLPYDQLYNYDPDLADPIKNRYRGEDSDLPAYFKAWFQMLLKHPANYLETHFTNHWLDMTPVEPDCHVNIMSTYSPDVEEIGAHRVFSVMPTRLFIIIRAAYVQLPLISILAAPGAYTWAMWICAIQMIRRKRYSSLLAVIPGLMNILFCIASPLNGAIRYELPTIAVLPIVLCWTIDCSRERQQKNQTEAQRSGFGLERRSSEMSAL